MNNKSEKLNNFENKVKYVTKDWIEIFEDDRDIEFFIFKRQVSSN